MMMSCPHNFVHISITENDKNLIFRYDIVNLTFYPPKVNEELYFLWHISIQGYTFTYIWQKIDIFHIFMYDACDKLWGHDIITSLKWIFIRTGQELFSENMVNFKNSYLPYFLSDFYDFCTILLEFFFSVLWNDDNFGPDFLFKEWKSSLVIFRE